ncbi:GNAT superfamily N-acetyltransferase [Rhodopseudomonas julia]|uniref:GNAT superfamily N-acetyltransferase n=1 Tax=Rhodopseudomonas julia TaxID=200617 RepID=A0ABU0C6N8_9BRAD|nr:GNAT family N-acetyltransferase [Rhodopseudomonas julia]MDQ0325853.1 GNAT superfamily N-acetyltransferase [Rhodopseudomonas julia]
MHDRSFEPEFLEVHRNGYLISSDPQKIDLEYVLTFLTTEAYWSRGMDPALIIEALKNSLVLGLFDASDKQVGFARIITDYALFAYLRDVFVDDAHRGRGLGLWITETALAHPRLQTVPSWMLATEDAHGVYEKAGFHALKHPEWYMQRLGAAPDKDARN